jgi:hypothetical protein
VSLARLKVSWSFVDAFREREAHWDRIHGGGGPSSTSTDRPTTCPAALRILSGGRSRHMRLGAA